MQFDFSQIQCSGKYNGYQWIQVHYQFNRHIMAKNLFFEPDISLTYMCKLGSLFRLIKHCIVEDNVTHAKLTLWKRNLPYLDSWKVWTCVFRLLKINYIWLKFLDLITWIAILNLSIWMKIVLQRCFSYLWQRDYINFDSSHLCTSYCQNRLLAAKDILWPRALSCVFHITVHVFNLVVFG